MFYNVENLFDIYDDTLINDNDFLPGGLMRWNKTRYQKKINSLYKTIIAAGEWDPPAIVAMCETENREVLENLVFNTYLSKYNYRIIHEDSPDRRGIDVCMIFRNDCINLIDYEYWIPEDMKTQFSSRTVLYSRINIHDDTIHLIINHWPSRRGGVMAGEGLRMRIAAMIRESIDSIYGGNQVAQKVIVCGDFNCTPGDIEIKALTNITPGSASLINLSENLVNSDKGTYRFQGNWEIIDQVIVSEEMINCSEGVFTGPDNLSIFRADFLLVKDPKYPGSMPFSTYRGYKYQGGYSDHLPVLLDLYFRQNH
jgi:endonuclease/exonuclease/phosphatase family metal-dependent hydrolase